MGRIELSILNTSSTACCWALVCAYCVGARHEYATRSNELDWLPSGQDLVDHVATVYPHKVVVVDKYQCYGLLPEDSLKFVRRFGMRYESVYPFTGIRDMDPPPWNPNVCLIKLKYASS